MRSMIWKSTFREIKESLGRFLAILAIVALGVGFFAGLKVTQPAMLKTAQRYFDKTALYDYRLISTVGFSEDEVETIAPKVFERDKKRQSLVNNKIGKTSLGLGVTSMLLARAFPIEKYLNFTSHLLNLSLMMLILIFVVGLRIWMGRGEGMQEIVADKTP